MSNFNSTIGPTPFGFFDADPQFQAEADAMITYVKRMLGDDVLSVELTRKQIWANLEDACCEYARLIHETKITSELTNVLGMPTGSVLTNRYPRQSLEYQLRMAEPYATEAYVGGSTNAVFGYFDLEEGRQDYDIYGELKDFKTGLNVYNNLPSGLKGKMKIVELFQMEPLAAQTFLLNASNITNFLATNFNYESYVNSTIFYVLPVFEDVLRRGMLESAFRVRRSHYSYQIMGSKLRIYPIPIGQLNTKKMFCRVMPPQDVMNPTAYVDETINGISGANNMPLLNIPFSTINQPGRHWIRQYTLASCKVVLGLIRSKFQNIPIPNADLQLNGESLLSQGREDKDKLVTQMKEFLANLTNAKLLEATAAAAESLNKQLRYVPMPLGKSIVIG